MDADLATDLAVIPQVVKQLEAGADIVLGDRRDRRSQLTRRQPPLREWLGRGFTLLARALIDVRVRDFTCGLKGYARESARAISDRSWIDGWACDAEIIALARSLGLKRSTVPVSWAHVDGSRVRPLPDSLRCLRDLVRVIWARARGLYAD
jgi:dolichyl-phosphate beta-glucosyltransferase